MTENYFARTYPSRAWQTNKKCREPYTQHRHNNYNNVQIYGQNLACAYSVLCQHKTNRTNDNNIEQVIDDSFYFGVEEDEEDAKGPESFPVTYPFSATVPEIGLALLKVRGAATTRPATLSLLLASPPPPRFWWAWLILSSCCVLIYVFSRTVQACFCVRVGGGQLFALGAGRPLLLWGASLPWSLAFVTVGAPVGQFAPF